MNPLVSIITPCYNCGRFIESTIQSVLNQTYDNFEFIIVNDGSTDNSEEKILHFRDDRIRYFSQSNRGQGAANNFGTARAKGAYIKFFDADDLMNNKHIEAQIKKMGNGKKSIVSCSWGAFYNDDPDAALFNPSPSWRDMKPVEWLRSELCRNPDMLAGWLWLIPAKLLEKAGGWDERLTLNNDFEFSIRLALNADKVLFAEEAKMMYRWATSEGLSTKKSEKSYRDALLSTYLGCSYLLGRERSREMVKICVNRYKMWLTRIPEEYVRLRLSVNAEIGKLEGSK